MSKGNGTNNETLIEPKSEEFITLSEEEQQEILRKYDPESNTRDVGGNLKKIVFIGLLAFSCFQLYTGIFGQLTAYIQRSIHLGFALSLIFILFPKRSKPLIFPNMLHLTFFLIKSYYVFYLA